MIYWIRGGIVIRLWAVLSDNEQLVLHDVWRIYSKRHSVTLGLREGFVESWSMCHWE